ncbi:TolC family protein [Bizionia paragorgiae]|uniref:Outer membrane protein TolC n=1 Tax=Bizionia paragorgiae TaxID=283786 RepID=A0A1H4AWP1_BIZPA|nr:TolC family protein [Bizionia paragorgiae]SEA40208.1 Outer membrane protein TolC [Bizionia paragorgiae]
MKNKITVLFFLFSLSLFSQDNVQRFTLQEAIDYALANNRTALNAQLDVEAAKQQKRETVATGLPQLSGNIDYQNSIKQQFPGIDFDGDGNVDFGAKQSMTVGAVLNQKIFDGSYIVGLQSAKVYLEISKNAKEKTDLQIREAVINAYGNVLLAEESLEIINSNIAILEKNVNETTKIFENGLEEEESVEQLKITLSGVKSQLNNTKRLKSIAYQMLNITLGLDVNAAIELTDDLEALTTQNMSLELLAAPETITDNIDYKIAANDKVSKELLVDLERSKALPTLNAFLNGSYIGNNEAFQFTTRHQNWIGTAAFGATLHIPIFSSGMRSASTQRARINLEKAEANLIETEQQLRLEIASAKSDYELAIEEYSNKKENLNLAERIENKNQTKFFEGVGSSFELRQAQTQLYAAQQEFLQAMLNVINAKAELETVLNQPTY